MINLREIPVPIPNTEVKLKIADDTCELPCLENRYCQIFIFLVSSVGRALGC